MSAATHIGRRPPTGEPAEQAPVDEILDQVVALVDDLGRDLTAEPEEQLLLALPTASRRPRLARPRWLGRDSLSNVWLSIALFAAVVAVQFFVIHWFASR